MKSSNFSGLHKFASFVLIAVLLIFVVGFAANGWEEGLWKPDNGEDGNKTDNTDENTDGPNNNQNNDLINGDSSGNDENLPPDNNNGENNENNTPPENTDENEGAGENQNPEDVPDNIPSPPVYISTITGLEITEEQKYKIPYGFIVNPAAPLYGISSTELAIEFPIEDGTTRMLSYTTDNSALWKIGSLVETRAFISAMSHFYGGIIVSYGNDDVIPYSIWDLSKLELDLKKHEGSYYRENAKHVYTSAEKLSYAEEGAIRLEGEPYHTAPFDFTEEELIFGVSEATSVIIPYSDTSKTELYYSEKTDRYLLYKSGNRKVDMLSGKNITFENVFVLFADATTYEKAAGTELVMDVMSGGNGYYATKGTMSEITWSLNELGELNFYSLSGERLVVNLGNSYIGYYKASLAYEVKIS